jgi:hypothetical protein
MDPPELLSGKQCYSSRGLRYCRSPGYDGASSLAWIPKTDGIAFTFPRLDINATFPLCSLIMATAHASARGQRTAILASPLRQPATTATRLSGMRCGRCGAPAAGSLLARRGWLRVRRLNERVRPRRVALLGPEVTISPPRPSSANTRI